MHLPHLHYADVVRRHLENLLTLVEWNLDLRIFLHADAFQLLRNSL